jgi:hypothetical protein
MGITDVALLISLDDRSMDHLPDEDWTAVG